MKYHCRNCGPIDHIFPLQDAHERLEPGDTVPNGQCACGSMAFDEQLHAQMLVCNIAPDLLAIIQQIVDDVDKFSLADGEGSYDAASNFIDYMKASAVDAEAVLEKLNGGAK